MVYVLLMYIIGKIYLPKCAEIKNSLYPVMCLDTLANNTCIIATWHILYLPAIVTMRAIRVKGLIRHQGLITF